MTDPNGLCVFQYVITIVMMFYEILFGLVTACALQYPTPIFNNHILASFPKTSVDTGIALLHTPNMWANGACIALGMKRFKILSTSPTLKLRNETIRTFKVQGHTQEITCVSEYPFKTTVHIGDGLSLRVKLTPYTSKPIGFSLSIGISGIPVLPTLNPEWSINCRMWLETVLFSLVVNQSSQECQNDICKI